MRALLTIVFILTVIVIGLSVYLAPDDLSKCEKTPGDNAPCQTVDAIVAISGGDTAARAVEAIELYKLGWAPLIIFSGAAQDKSGPSNAQVMRQIALESGVPREAIILENEGETTKENAEKTQGIVKEKGMESVILVTSAYHQRRAGLEFTKRAESVQVYNHPVERDKQWSAWWWATPGGWYLALSEFSKVIVFYMGGTR